jgi:hypothetical protein
MHPLKPSPIENVFAMSEPQHMLSKLLWEIDGLTADSDDLARVYRFDLAQDSEMMSPTIPI